jgi:LysR family cys regulon transcriptional activator
MTLQQLRYLCGIVDQGFSVSRAAEVLFTSQPGISKQVQMLERELGIELLIRQGNRITGLTGAGVDVVEMGRRMLHDGDNIKRIGDEHTRRSTGRLVVATTHIHARYVLRPVIPRFKQKYAEVNLVLRQGSPAQIAEWVASGEVDVGIGGKPPQPVDDVVFLPCGALQRSVLAPLDHPLLRKRQLTLKAIAEHPLITLDTSFSGGWAVTNAFALAGIVPNIVLTAIDADVIKSYVELGLGVAVLPSIVHEPKRDLAIGARDASRLFAPTVTQIELRRGTYLRGYVVDFIAMVHPHWTSDAIRRALSGAV